MPVSSYIVYARPGKTVAVGRRLAALPGCDVRSSDDGSVLVLVTDTASETEDAALSAQIQSIPELEALALVFRHADPESSPEIPL